MQLTIRKCAGLQRQIIPTLSQLNTETAEGRHPITPPLHGPSATALSLCNTPIIPLPLLLNVRVTAA